MHPGYTRKPAGTEHLGHLLLTKGLIGKAGAPTPDFKPRQEIMKMRFDPKYSPMDAIPVDLRQAPLQPASLPWYRRGRPQGKCMEGIHPVGIGRNSDPVSF